MRVVASAFVNSLTEAISCYPPIIEDVALAIADDAYPGLSRMHYHGMLDEFAEPLFSGMRQLPDVPSKLARFREHICDELGFAGNRDDYYDPRNSYLNEVLEGRVGIPIALAIVWMAIGRRAGLLVEGIGFPGHFLVRVGGRGGIYVDVFNEGQTLDERDLEHLGRRATGGAIVPSRYLSPISARDMAIRMLLNLRGIYASAHDHARAMVTCDRLFDLTASPQHRRDRGVHALELGAREAALADFEAYLVAEPTAEDATRIRALLEDVAADRAPLN